MNDTNFEKDRRDFLQNTGSTGVASDATWPEGKYYSKNIEWIGYHDLDGKPDLQMAMQIVEGQYYLYLACFFTSGWQVLDLTDPAHPTSHKFIPSPGVRKGTIAGGATKGTSPTRRRW